MQMKVTAMKASDFDPRFISTTSKGRLCPHKWLCDALTRKNVTQIEITN